MCEVNSRNFKFLYPEIKKRLQESKFCSIDTEFSALDPLPDKKASIFDTPSERYSKLNANLSGVVPLQVGLTAFSFDPKKNSYLGKVYTFYVQPASFQYIHRSFYMQTGTINFLKLYNFDFNKFVYDGIPFMNRDQELRLKDKMSTDEVSDINNSCKNVLEKIIDKEINQVKNWYAKAPVGATLVLPNVCTEGRSNEEIIFFVHKAFRSMCKNLWTYVENGEFVVKKVSPEEYRKLNFKYRLEDETIDNLLGFSKVFRLLVELQKPIVGHNVFQDLLLIVGNFETTLPKKYLDFKELISKLLPTIFDTKSISYELKSMLPKEKQWIDNGLNIIFDYFKNGVGRILATNSPAIEMDNPQLGYDNFHNAGWDSFCTGYVFISELIAGLEQYKNRINIIRGSTSYINLDKADPESNRPPKLVIESLKNRPVNVAQVTALLSTYGFVEVKRLPYQKYRALIAIDNYVNARRILTHFNRNDSEYRISKYHPLRHSSGVKVILISGLAVSSAAILWFTFR
ncbi:pre-piRNA 3'-exonuclease trimmer-like isoform X2 [Euwallacea fornicatus]|uniref:pre-piRNA 3'-exonuclease trimmer-like isoform X2 n=1 Tax=Euwallacea fornicatus TaxID=995702 RepID=UPI00338E6A41